MASPSKLSKLVVQPSRLASTLDWKRKTGCLMGLEISKDRIAVAIAAHPHEQSSSKIRTANTTTVVHQLDPIPYKIPSNNNNCSSNSINSKKNEHRDRVYKEINALVEEHGVCGFVVGWPLEKTGHPGNSCGRVLHLLDYLAEGKEKNGILNKNRPIAFWDEREFTHQQFDDKKMLQDEWGRSLAYCYVQPTKSDDNGDANNDKEVCIISNQGNHPTSKDSTSARLILGEFMKTHWDIIDESPADLLLDQKSNETISNNSTSPDTRDDRANYDSVRILLEEMSSAHNIEPSIL